MSSPTDVGLTDAGAKYREAKQSIAVHRRIQAAAEKTHRRQPTPENWEAVQSAVGDVRWCQALVIACGEVIKGRPFDDVMERNAVNGRPEVR